MLLFGAKRLPDMARSFGQSLRIIKSETKAMTRADSHVAAAEPTHSDQRSDLPLALRTAPSEPESVSGNRTGSVSEAVPGLGRLSRPPDAQAQG
ncbi:twin-arginine translocase TatA/TatE family subunit [Streptomyces luteogriseus]|uniref:twin-arginine translocase TatA/TatE family subunit n=1 Tax=Streptomyces luteogriseus TaxID=68233 RepID=UPI00359448B0